MFETPEDRLSEIQLYELVAEEIANNQQSRGLWVKAISDTEGNHEKAKALYIKLRVEMIKDEWAYADKVAAEEAKQAEARGAAEQQRQRYAEDDRKRKEDKKQREAYLASEREKGWGRRVEWDKSVENTKPDRVPLYMMLIVLGILILGIAALTD
jgi:hypothetical protein